MSYHQASYELSLPDDSPALERLAIFYEANGYEVSGEDDERVFRRGKPKAGWFSSDMTDLETEVHVRITDVGIDLTLKVDIRGQRFTDKDRAFFHDEVEAAEEFLMGDQEKPRDLRPQEALRAKKANEELRSAGNQLAMFLFIMIILFGVIASFLGLDPFPFF